MATSQSFVEKKLCQSWKGSPIYDVEQFSFSVGVHFEQDLFFDFLLNDILQRCWTNDLKTSVFTSRYECIFKNTIHYRGVFDQMEYIQYIHNYLLRNVGLKHAARPGIFYLSLYLFISFKCPRKCSNIQTRFISLNREYWKIGQNVLNLKKITSLVLKKI